jgi:hypothetical protein
MEADVSIKEFIYRSSLSVLSKSPLNFGSMLNVYLFNKHDFSLSNDLISELLNAPKFVEKKESQLDKIRAKNIIKVAIVNDKAYFVHENIFYTAALINGEVDRSSASPINAFDISKKEIKMLLSILDNMNS